MPIEAKTLWDAAGIFCTEMNGVLGKTIGTGRFVRSGANTAVRLAVGFRQESGGPSYVRLKTRYGKMRLVLGQNCEAVPGSSSGLRRLVTVRYKYTLALDGKDEPFFRWEYIKNPEAGNVWCRHHLQGPSIIRLERTGVRLNDWHLPTGYVPIEDVIRFCIHDLGANAPKNWHEVLTESYERFRTEFTP